MKCRCEVSVLARSLLNTIEAEVKKLRQAVVDGTYDPRSIVGDATLVIEAQLKELYEFFPSLEEQRAQIQEQPIPLTFEELKGRIPQEHRGVQFDKLEKGCHPHEGVRRLEMMFTDRWAQRNNARNEHSPLLLRLLTTDGNDPAKKDAPASGREWRVAYLAAATLIRWLPTNSGRGFQRSVYENVGGKAEFTLPKITE